MLLIMRSWIDTIRPNIVLADLDWCIVSGEPHYNTFNRCPLNYQGTCKHLLAAPSSSYTGRNRFAVYLKSEHVGGNNRVSWARYVEIEVCGDIVRLTRSQSSQPVSGIDVTVREHVRFITVSKEPTKCRPLPIKILVQIQ
jgi:hypothetical protein